MVKIKRIVDWDIAFESALFTVSKDSNGKIPSDNWKKKACMAEHSMLTDVRYIVEFEAPCWVSQHIARHDAFAGHTVRETKEVHYVSTSRTDRTGIDRNKMPQDSPVMHRINLSAKDFINISKLRLCKCASKETQKIWKEIIEELSKIDPELASCCVKTCVYRGDCPEFVSCGYNNTTKFKEELSKYWSK